MYIFYGGSNGWRTWSSLAKIDENKLASAFSQSKSKGGWFLGRNPNLTSFCSVACSRCLVSESAKPHQTGEAYRSLLTRVAFVISQRFSFFRPWDFSTFKAYNPCAVSFNLASKCVLKDKFYSQLHPEFSFLSPAEHPGSRPGIHRVLILDGKQSFHGSCLHSDLNFEILTKTQYGSTLPLWCGNLQVEQLGMCRQRICLMNSRVSQGAIWNCWYNCFLTWNSLNVVELSRINKNGAWNWWICRSDGWMEAENGEGKKGLVPINYLQVDDYLYTFHEACMWKLYIIIIPTNKNIDMIDWTFHSLIPDQWVTSIFVIGFGLPIIIITIYFVNISILPR